MASEEKEKPLAKGPSAPRDLRVVPADGLSFVVEWREPKRLGTSRPISYTVRVNDVAFKGVIQQDKSREERWAVKISGVSGGCMYRVSVDAQSEATSGRVPGTPVSRLRFNTDPSQPQNLRMNTEGGRTTLRWDAPLLLGTGLLKFELMRPDSTLLASTELCEIEMKEHLSEDQQSCFLLRSIDETGRKCESIRFVVSEDGSSLEIDRHTLEPETLAERVWLKSQTVDESVTMPKLQRDLPEDLALSLSRVSDATLFEEQHSSVTVIPSELSRDKCVKMLLISDTHGRHDGFDLDSWPEDIDVLVHAGDFTMTGKRKEVRKFEEFGRLIKERTKIKHLIVIAGNHERSFDAAHFKRKFPEAKEGRSEATKSIISESKHWIYLEHESIEICGIKLFGTPFQPYFQDWAFNCSAEELKAKWQDIPEDTEVLVSHGPPFGHGDLINYQGGLHVGCPHLLRRVALSDRHSALKLHVFGHIHEARSVTRIGDQPWPLFVNATSVNIAYKLVFKPILVSVPLGPLPKSGEAERVVTSADSSTASAVSASDS